MTQKTLHEKYRDEINFVASSDKININSTLTEA